MNLRKTARNALFGIMAIGALAYAGCGPGKPPERTYIATRDVDLLSGHYVIEDMDGDGMADVVRMSPHGGNAFAATGFEDKVYGATKVYPLSLQARERASQILHAMSDLEFEMEKIRSKK